MSKILFVIDKIELKYFEFNNLVTNFWLIKEFLETNNEVYITTMPNLSLMNNIAYANCSKSYVENNNIFYKKNFSNIKIDDFDLVLFRPDPPVDIDYINATYVFDYVSTKVVNSPKTIRNFNEKLHSLYFKEYMTECLVSSNMDEIIMFLEKHKQIVLKPLNRCFGAGVMYLYLGDPNTRTIIKTITQDENSMVMVQEFIPEVKFGDIRVLTLGNKILPYSIKKLPSENDFKFNTHNDNFLVKSELTLAQLNQFQPIAEKLHAMGIYMAGLDVINNKVIEINVTSPCYFIKEINKIYSITLEKEICKYITSLNSEKVVGSI